MAIATKKYMPRRTRSKYGPVGSPAYVTRRKGKSSALKKAQEALKKSNAAKRNLSKKLKSSFFQGSGIKPMAALTIAGGGALAGASKVHMPAIAGFATPLVVGGGLTAASMFWDDDAISPILGALGAGMLASWSSDATAMALLSDPAE